MKEIELINKRKPKEKHYLQEDGTIIAKLYSEDVHYYKDGKYEEIDNSIIEEETHYHNRLNSFNVRFGKSNDEKLFKINSNENYVEFDLKNKSNKKIYKNNKKLKFENIMNDIDFDYEIKSNKVKESIIIKNKESIIKKFEFEVDSNLKFKSNDDGSISAFKEDKEIFKIEAPYMIDDNKAISYDAHYKIKNVFNKTIIELYLNENWLLDKNRKYPVIVDPTITNTTNSSGVQDTYINSKYPDLNFNEYDELYVYAEQFDEDTEPRKVRSLIKFELPEIPTSCEIIEANLRLIGYLYSNMYLPVAKRLLSVHKITESWDETTATWENMNDKYDSRVETCFLGGGSYYNTDEEIEWQEHYANITSLVKKWYMNEENYGIMIKEADEITPEKTGHSPKFISNANIITGENPQPTLLIKYKDLNGIEEYIEYFTQDFEVGKIKANSFNGNLVGLFNIGKINKGTEPIALNIVYNTNDVITNYNEGYGLGWRLNFMQTITYYSAEDMFEYVDFDGTKHYFIKYKEIYDENGRPKTLDEENTYYDEDGLNLKIITYENKYELIDKENTVACFEKTATNKARLSYIIDRENNQITIEYENNQISKIRDSLNRIIQIIYGNNKINIVSDGKDVELNYIDNKLISIIYGDSEFDNLPISITYNDKKLISSVQYSIYKTVDYEYYNKYPYKTKKINEHDRGYINISYNNLSTTIDDNLGRVTTLVFNDYGNLKSISNLKSKDFVKTALGRMVSFGEKYQEKNRLTSYGDLIGYVNNLLNNTSFEENNNIFSSESGIISEISSDQSNSGNNSLKISNIENNKYIYKELELEKGKDYTFSGYFKNDNLLNIHIKFEYNDKNGELVSSEELIDEINQQFNRYDVSIKYPEDATSNLKIKIGSENIGIFYMDDIQLEEGFVANHYNYIDNSDFSQGSTGWYLSVNPFMNEIPISVQDVFEVVSLPGGAKALKIKMGLLHAQGIDRTIPISGKQGDSYTLSFWYKNQGISSNVELDQHYNCCIVLFEYEQGQCANPSINLNPNTEEWQFFTYTFYAQHDYTSVYMSIFQQWDANDLYITNISLLKNIKKSYTSYDKEGNLISTIDNNETETIYNYDENNNIIKMFESDDTGLSFEYDNEYSNKIKTGISNSGVCNEIKYNEYNNPILTRLSNKISNKIQEKNYNIRLKGTRKYLNLINRLLLFNEMVDFQTRWKVECITIDGKDYYKIKHSILNNKYISKNGANIVLNEYRDDTSLFEIIKNENGSFSIKLYNDEKYIKVEDEKIICSEYNKLESYNYEFYFEEINNINFIENTASYTTDNRFINKIVNSSFNEVKYEFDEETERMTGFTNTNGTTTNTFYNNIDNNLTGVKVDERTIRYIYNGELLSTVNYIVSGNILKSYYYHYDEKNRLSGLKVGGHNFSYPLYTKEYDNDTGNLLKVINSDNSKTIYEYDIYNKISKIITDNDTYEYYYDKNGNIGKVISNNHIYKYVYDCDKKTVSHNFDNFKANYAYNTKNLLETAAYKLKDTFKETSYIYHPNELLKSIINNGNNLEYIYDALGRVCEYKYNNISLAKLDYTSNGKRTTNKIEKIKTSGNDEYYYKYDKLDNITHIYHNNSLKNKYSYDMFNQLIQEDNYKANTTTRYKYDDSGNIISKKIYKLNSYELIESTNYNYNMLYNCDVLTSFNDIEIYYDTCFNPTSIGDDIKLNWINKNQLNEYINTSNNITVRYEYDKDGNRIKKKINEKEIEYYWSNGKLIIEKQEDKLLYFIYDINGELLGFEYNGVRYNYLKSSNREIIGILDNNSNLIAKYEYDAWGKIISIVDNNNNDVTLENEHIANINPFVYKCYYYDKETNLYYLKRRYYNPQFCRYISPDITLNNDIFGLNPYVYCSNNPITRYDPNGNSWLLTAITIGVNMVYGAIVSVAANTVTNLATGRDWNEGIIGAAIGGAAGGAITTAGYATTLLVSLSTSVPNEIASYVSNDKNSSSSTPYVKEPQKKEVNIKNIGESFANVAFSAALDLATFGTVKELEIDKLTGKITKFDQAIKPKNVKAAFFGNYTLRKQYQDFLDNRVSDTLKNGVNLLLGPTELSNSDLIGKYCEVNNDFSNEAIPFSDFQQPILK